MRICSISVNGLFGIFNHEIRLNLAERITIIHSPNGYGKTAILRILDAVFNRNWKYLSSVPFGFFLITFDNGSTLQIDQNRIINKSTSKNTSKTNRLRAARRPEISISLLDETNKALHPVWKMGQREHEAQREIRLPLNFIERVLPFLKRIGIDTWEHVETGETLQFEDVIDRYRDSLPGQLIANGGQLKTPTWLSQLIVGIPVRLIQTQRIDGVSAQAMDDELRTAAIPTVNKYSDEIRREIKATIAAYASKTQELDSSFPTRLLEQTSTLTLVALQKKMAQLEERRAQLIDLGFLDPEKDKYKTPTKISEGKIDVLSVYVQDVEDKLSVFEEVATKIHLLTQIINRKFKYKKMSINKEKGFVFTSTVVADEPILAPASLSSGEQHELVLLYELLFKVKKDSLILIDEPEISLHIAWQRQFLKDLSGMVELSRFDVLTATHSPAVIGNRWDLTVELKGPQ